MYQNDPKRVLTGECRLSYVHVLEPKSAPNGGDAKYSVTLLIPKSDTVTKADIDASMKAAAQEALPKIWNGAWPANMRTPLYDGDGVRTSGEPFSSECRGYWVMTASSKTKPMVVGCDNINSELAPSDIYSGMHGRVTIRFFGYSKSGNKGIGCGLGNIMKTRDDEPLAGRSTAAVDFAGVGNSVVQPPQADLQSRQPPQMQSNTVNGFPGQLTTMNPFTGQPL